MELRQIKVTNLSQVEPAIQSILSKYGINFNNNAISGGKRTRKNKKQRGGFTYKSHSKRRSISSKTTSTGSKRKSRKSSR